MTSWNDSSTPFNIGLEKIASRSKGTHPSEEVDCRSEECFSKTVLSESKGRFISTAELELMEKRFFAEGRASAASDCELEINRVKEDCSRKISEMKTEHELQINQCKVESNHKMKESTERALEKISFMIEKNNNDKCELMLDLLLSVYKQISDISPPDHMVLSAKSFLSEHIPKLFNVDTITVRLSHDVASLMQEGSCTQNDKRINILAVDGMENTDCVIEWDGGAVKKSRNEVLEDIRQALDSHFAQSYSD